MQTDYKSFMLVGWLGVALSGGTANATVQIDSNSGKAAEVVVVHYHKNWVYDSAEREVPHVTDHDTENIQWDLNQEGSWTWTECYGSTGGTFYYWWDDAFWGTNGVGTDTGNSSSTQYPGGGCGVRIPNGASPYTAPTAWPGESCAGGDHRVVSTPYHVFDETVTRDALTRYKLRTGGKKGVGRKSLFVLTTSFPGQALATGHADLFYPETDYYPVTYPIANEAIVLGDLGPLGSDGVLYKALPEGETYDVTPTVAGSRYYRYNQPGATPYIPVIKANDMPLDPEAPNVEFCVGQKVTFKLAWPSTPPGLTSESGWDWYISAKRKNYQSPPNSAGCVTYEDHADLWRVAQPYAWWISGGTKNARLDETLTFANGQTAKISARGKFKMFRPKISLVPVGAAPSFFPNYHGAVPGIQLGGDGDQRDGNHAMAFEVSYDAANYSGTGAIAQLLTADYSARPSLTFSDWRLDGSAAPYVEAPIDPFHYPAPQTNVPFDDEPQNYQPFIFSRIWVQASFQDYCMFRPDTGSPDQNIFVTLGIITWSCDGELSQIAIGEPGFPGIKVTKDQVVGPAGPVDSDQFPYWEKNCPEGSRAQ